MEITAHRKAFVGPLEFESGFDKTGSGLEYRLEVEPSPDFDPESEHPYTAHLDIPDLK